MKIFSCKIKLSSNSSTSSQRHYQSHDHYINVTWSSYCVHITFCYASNSSTDSLLNSHDHHIANTWYSPDSHASPPTVPQAPTFTKPNIPQLHSDPPPTKVRHLQAYFVLHSIARMSCRLFLTNWVEIWSLSLVYIAAPIIQLTVGYISQNISISHHQCYRIFVSFFLIACKAQWKAENLYIRLTISIGRYLLWL